jgi:Flp pilus assembly protein TadG
MPQTHFESLRKRREKGIAVYLTAFFMMILIPIVGLSIDGGYAFVIQSRLQAAADGAALAAGRGLNFTGGGSAGITAANTQATTAANNFFTADFPVGYMNTLSTSRTVTPTFTVQTNSSGNPTGQLSISISASVLAPTYFMKWLGIPSLTIVTSAAATRKMLVMELVLDKSSSMLNGSGSRSTSGVPASTSSSYTSCDNMVAAAAQFTTYFSPYDTIGLVSFDLSAFDDNNAGGDGSYTASTNYWESGSSGIQKSIGDIACGSNTNTTAGLYRAYQDIVAVGEPLALNVIVLFTDGVPNGVDATFPVRTQVDARMSAAQGGGGGCQDTGGTTLCNASSVSNSVHCPGATGCAASSPSYGMAVCTTTAGTIKAAISQWAGFATAGGTRGAANIISTDSTPSAPAGCTGFTPNNDATVFTSQTIAYIPNSDFFGNSMINIQTGNSASPTATSPWFQWLYQVNSQTAPSSVSITSGNSATKNLGDYWTNDATTGAGAPNNTFTSGPYSGYLRPDLPNTIGTASMISATNEAYTIRNDTTYNPIIDIVYLQGNGSDPVDRSFLQLVSNQQYIQPLLYQQSPGCSNSTDVGALYNAFNSSLCNSATGTFVNPYYVSSQQQGMWLQTADSTQLTAMFEAIASSVLRLSQ